MIWLMANSKQLNFLVIISINLELLKYLEVSLYMDAIILLVDVETLLSSCIQSSH